MGQNYKIVMHPSAMNEVEAYCSDLQRYGTKIAGVHLQNSLTQNEALNSSVVLGGLLNTKKPMIFAESEVKGDGSDWTSRELSMLGDIGIVMDVRIYDDGRHTHPEVHAKSFEGMLLFVPGPLLRNDRGGIAADWNAVVRNNEIDQELYDQLILQRLLPPLLYAGSVARSQVQKAFVTVPGIGCGQFAGRFKGQMAEHLKIALMRMLDKFSTHLHDIAAIYFDPYSECQNERHRFGDLSLMVRPLLEGNHQRAQLCPPSAYEEDGDDFSNCMFASYVAWDHVSWPGNDYYGGHRSTDDGVKAAATSSMFSMTGLKGYYDPYSNCYMPPVGYDTWGQVVQRNNIKIGSEGRLVVVG